MNLSIADLGKIVAVQLLDHVENGAAPAVCVVYGRLVHFTPTMLIVRAWEEIGGDHHTNFAIVRGAVTEIEVLSS